MKLLKLILSGAVLFLAICIFGLGTVGHESIQQFLFAALLVDGGLLTAAALVGIWKLDL